MNQTFTTRPAGSLEAYGAQFSIFLVLYFME